MRCLSCLSSRGTRFSAAQHHCQIGLGSPSYGLHRTVELSTHLPTTKATRKTDEHSSTSIRTIMTLFISRLLQITQKAAWAGVAQSWWTGDRHDPNTTAPRRGAANTEHDGTLRPPPPAARRRRRRRRQDASFYLWFGAEKPTTRMLRFNTTYKSHYSVRG